jgi:hypothetical protein
MSVTLASPDTIYAPPSPEDRVTQKLYAEAHRGRRVFPITSDHLGFTIASLVDRSSGQPKTQDEQSKAASISEWDAYLSSLKTPVTLTSLNLDPGQIHDLSEYAHDARVLAETEAQKALESKEPSKVQAAFEKLDAVLNTVRTLKNLSSAPVAKQR